MAIYIYNSLSRKKEEFKPIKKNSVRMYVCGPTVYDESHIGHARGAFVFDVIRNYFRYKRFKVKYVRNVTDVDDKIINKAKELKDNEADLKKTARKVADKYLEKYREDMKTLGLCQPDVEPKATGHINDMLHIIKTLLKKGYAYKAGGDVYFRVKRFNGYGKLSRQSVKMMESGARITPGENKEDPLDFALWKKSKEEEPSWKSGSIEGRPGWHIECSAMSMKHLGDNFDIHGGGVDLIFPHHENEIAQSESYSGKRFANYWIHNGLLTINGQKMAKSMGNYLSISDFLHKYKDPDILKLFFLSAHYSSPVDFTDDNIKAAKSAKERFSIFFAEAEELISKVPVPKAVRLKHKHREMFETLKKEFENAMDDNFNTPSALAALFNAVTKGNSIISSGEGNVDEKAIFLNTLLESIRELGGVLGLSFAKVAISNEFKKMVEKMLKARKEARKKKDYKTADQIRMELTALGVIVEDAEASTKWRLR
jgi:cysteinyl-tRNA synthetase